jgi:hypothetical protein
MAVWTIKNRNDLADSFVLAPERYDPRRKLSATQPSERFALSDIAVLIRNTVSATTAAAGRYFVLDTSNAKDGLIIRPKRSLGPTEIGSAKKIVEPNDVIISRLRPYLRQVALVDSQIRTTDREMIVCSTEFLVLRSRNAESIAFLVPFLLSDPVQEVLAASQEGGHHPRFNEASLLTLPVPEQVFKERQAISVAIEKYILRYRESEDCFSGWVEYCSRALLA